jgi:hypothetical protein
VGAAGFVAGRGARPRHRLGAHGTRAIHPTKRELPGAPSRVQRHRIDAPLVRTQVGDTTVIAMLNGLAGVSLDPAITVRRIAGRFALMGSSIDVELAERRVQWILGQRRRPLGLGVGDGAPAVQAAIAADPIAFADLALFVPDVPRSGGGRVQLAIEGAGGSAQRAYRVTSPPTFTPRDPSCRGGVSLEFYGSNRPGHSRHRARPRSAPLRPRSHPRPARIPRRAAGALNGTCGRAQHVRRAARFAIDTLVAQYPTRPFREARVD